jgi:hypothetical protein
MATRLIRLTRLSKLISVLDISRAKRLVKAYFDASTRSDRMQQQYIVMYTIKIMRLIIVVFIITYIVGCVWFFAVRNMQTEKDIKARTNFYTFNNFDKMFESNSPKKCDPDVCKKLLNDKQCTNKEWQKKNCKLNTFR